MGEGDKTEGADDLFEDLDKFFAPIKDVDWPEPEAEEAQPAEAEAQEEHVAVHGGEPEAESDWEPEAPDAVEFDAAEETDATEAFAVDEPEEAEPGEAVWYDTESMDAVEDETPIVIEDAAPAEVPGQEDLFAGSEGEEDVMAADDAEETLDDAWARPEQPTEADVEAAAEHFAESIREEEGSAFGEEAVEEGERGDLLADMGAEEVEEDILSDLDETAGHTVKVGGEGLGGPSWQEPTSMEVGADLDRQPGRDVPAAFVTGLVLAAVAFGSLLIDRALFAVVAAVIILVAQGELFGVMHKHHKQPATGVGLVTGALILWGAYDRGEGAVLAMFALGTMATLLWFMAVPAIHRKDTLVNVGLTVFNVVYIPVLGSFLLLTLSIGRDGESLVATVIALTFVFDTVAFAAGATFGGSSIRRPLAPDTSPKKSWEGLIAASFVTILASVAVVGTFVDPFTDHVMNEFLLGVVISLAATFGDLAESLIKRDLAIKDMGSILPGHGGVLDRVDSLLFTAPAAFFLFRVLFA